MTTTGIRTQQQSSLGDTRVSEFMSRWAPRVLVDGDVLTAQRVLRSSGQSHAIVMESDGTGDGVVSRPAVDYAATHCATTPGLTVADLVLSRQSILTPASTAREALKLMLVHRTDAALVIDSGGRPLGLVTWSGTVKSLTDARRDRS